MNVLIELITYLNSLMLVECLSIILAAEVKQKGSQYLLEEEVMMYTPKYGTRTKIEVLVADSILEKIIEQLLNELSSGSVSDGKIFVSEVIQAYDIGTKNKNELAI